MTVWLNNIWSYKQVVAGMNRCPIGNVCVVCLGFTFNTTDSILAKRRKKTHAPLIFIRQRHLILLFYIYLAVELLAFVNLAANCSTIRLERWKPSTYWATWLQVHCLFASAYGLSLFSWTYKAETHSKSMSPSFWPFVGTPWNSEHYCNEKPKKTSKLLYYYI